MSVSVYRSHNPVHDKHLWAMFRSCPYPTHWIEDRKHKPNDIGVIWGMKKTSVPISWWRQEIFESHETVVVMDSGYVRRDSYQAVGLNGLNGRADFKPENIWQERFREFNVELKPWRKAGDHILLVGQVPWDASVDFTDHRKWLQETVDELKRHTARDIVFRPHPKAWKSLPPIRGTRYSRQPLDADLDNCHCVVTFNSNTGVDAVLNGIPVIATDDGSMVKAIASRTLKEIENPMMPDRGDWCEEIAHSQWNLQEMERGLPWKHLFASA